MVSRNNAVFRFMLDIKDFVTKGRRVVQVTNEISGSTQKASGSMDRLATSTQKTGQSMAANAVNFQTATQGMLNLSTAGVQTFTSFSNLDRAGNRLAMAQIGVSRATDLLNNKQLRLNELIAKGQGNSQKAVLLTNELKTARADLLVKTDKLKIEEGALFDIQLLFVTNIANVMISSLQTIVSLKNAHILTTVKQIVQERLLATTLFTKTTPAFTAATGSISAYNTAAKTTINTNRLLMIGIPGVGAALLGVSLAIQAYTENWGGFRDMIQSVLPFLKDKKELLGDVNAILGETTESQNQFNKALDTEAGLLFDLPKNLNLTADGLARINAELRGSKLDDIKRYNFELSKAVESGQHFPSASVQGGFQTQGRTQNTSNVVKYEGDTTSTAYGIPSFLAAHADDGRNAPREFVNQAGNYVRVDSRGNQYISDKPFTTPQDQFNEAMDVLGRGATYWPKQIMKGLGGLIQHLTAPTIVQSDIPFSGALTRMGQNIGRGFAEISAQFAGFESAEQKKTVEQLRQELIDITPTTSIFDRNRLLIGNMPRRPGAGKFIGGRLVSPTTGVIFGTKSFERLKADLANAGSDLHRDYSKEEIQQFRELVHTVQTDENAAALLLAQDQQLRQIQHVVVTKEDQEKFFNSLAMDKSKKDLLRLQAEFARKEEERQLGELRAGAMAVGLSVSEFGKRMRIGQIAKDTLAFLDPTGKQREMTKAQLKDLKSMGGIFTAGSQQFIPEKAKQAIAIRQRLEAGIFHNMGLPDDTQHDRLILRSFGRVGGIRLKSDDPLLRDTSGFGERRSEIFQRRMIDPVTGQDMGMMGIDIGRVAEAISLEEGFRIAELQKAMSGFTGEGGRASAALGELTRASSSYKRMQVEHALGQTKFNFGKGFFKSTGATAAYQVPRGTVRASQEFYDKLRIKDANTNRLRWGGTLVPGMAMDEEGAVIGGYGSAKAFSEAGKRKRYESWDRAREFADFFSGISKSVSGGRSNRRHQYTAMVNTMEEMKGVLSSAGLGYKTFNAKTGLRYRYTKAQYDRFHKEWAEVRAFNDNQYAKAKEINLLQEGFGLTGFTGSTLGLSDLQNEVAKQDELVKSIGLDRTEAFQIIDTAGRGREEIDDRIRFKDRMNSMSTGVSVL